MLIRMYLKSVDNCIHFVASSGVEAAAIKSASLIIVVEFSVFSSNCGNALSISPIYAWNLYFHSSKAPYSPVNVGGVILYLCMLIKPCVIVPSACVSPFAAVGVAIVVSYSSQVGAYCCTCMCAVVLFVVHLDCRTRIVCSATM